MYNNIAFSQQIKDIAKIRWNNHLKNKSISITSISTASEEQPKMIIESYIEDQKNINDKEKRLFMSDHKNDCITSFFKKVNEKDIVTKINRYSHNDENANPMKKDLKYERPPKPLRPITPIQAVNSIRKKINENNNENQTARENKHKGHNTSLTINLEITLSNINSNFYDNKHFLKRNYSAINMNNLPHHLTVNHVHNNKTVIDPTKKKNDVDNKHNDEKQLSKNASTGLLLTKAFDQDNSYLNIINIEDLVLLEDKIISIINSLSQKKNTLEDCIDWWILYFNSTLNGQKYDRFFIEKHSKLIVHTANNLEIFGVMLCYNISKDLLYLNQYNSLLNDIFGYLHMNYLLISKYIHHQIITHTDHIPKEKEKLVNNLEIYLKKKLPLITHVTESTITAKIKHNSKVIVEQIRTILNEIIKKNLYAQMNELFNNLTKVLNENMEDFFRDKVYYQYNILETKTPLLTNRALKPYTLILDLDETLISTQITKQGINKGIVHFRPGLINFLTEVREYYEIISFTAALQSYADPILNLIEGTQRYFDYRLYKPHTILHEKKVTKDLSFLGRDLSTVIIVDNLMSSFKLQKSNGILVKAYHWDDLDDNILDQLLDIILKIAKEKGDVRQKLIKYSNEILLKVTKNNNTNTYNK